MEARLSVGEELDLGAAGRSVGDQFVFGGDLTSTEEARNAWSGASMGSASSPASNATRAVRVDRGAAGRPDHRSGPKPGPAPGPVVNAVTQAPGVRRTHGQVTQRVLSTGDLATHLRTPRREPSPARGPSRSGRGVEARASVTSRQVAASNGPRGRPCRAPVRRRYATRRDAPITTWRHRDQEFPYRSQAGVSSWRPPPRPSAIGATAGGLSTRSRPPTGAPHDRSGPKTQTEPRSAERRRIASSVLGKDVKYTLTALRSRTDPLAASVRLQVFTFDNGTWRKRTVLWSARPIRGSGSR